MTRRIVWTGLVLVAFLLAAGIVQSEGHKSGHTGNVQLTIIITAGPDQITEGKRLFAHHAKWMAETHYRDGDKALLQYNVSMAPELSNPMDPTSEPTGNKDFVLMEVYESEAGVADHFAQAESWTEFENLLAWLGNCEVKMVTSAPVVHSLW